MDLGKIATDFFTASQYQPRRRGGQKALAGGSRRFSTGLVVVLIFLAPVLIMPAAALATSLKADENVIFFPTDGYADPAVGQWVLPVHGWVFEPEEDSSWRDSMVSTLLGALELGSQSLDSKLFQQRMRMFLVDNERGKTIDITIGEHLFQLGPSKANGHFTGHIELDRDDGPTSRQDRWVSFKSGLAGHSSFKGAAQLLNPEGLSVISDIDDTIKISNVSDKKELLANTFLREFRAVPQMADVYRQWKTTGAAFHYVSASPWQLYPSLTDFLDAQGFPQGSFFLRYFRAKDRTFINLFTSSEEFKTATIESLIQRFPGRKFFLVGDSGEKDPEIYGDIARRYPLNAIRIFIRIAPPETDQSSRFLKAFNGLAPERWILFRDPRVLIHSNRVDTTLDANGKTMDQSGH